LRSNIFLAIQVIPCIYGTQISFPFSQEPANSIYPEQYHSDHPLTPVTSIVILCSCLRTGFPRGPVH